MKQTPPLSILGANGSEHAEADGFIRALYEGRVSWAARQRALDAKTRACFASLRTDASATAALDRLLHGSPGHARLATIEPVSSQRGLLPGNTGLDALMHFARFHALWWREPEAWGPDENANVNERLGGLARHLFAVYPVPPVLDHAWLGGWGTQADEYRQWFLHLGGGGRMEQMRFPMPMTHKAAHHFLLAPADLSLPAALRWGQVCALGGNVPIARALSETFLAELQTDEAFWYSFVHFLVNHREIAPWLVGPVADYIRFRRFGANGDDGPEPNFSLKGRTPTALFARMEEWHETLNRMGKKAKQSWEPSGIVPLSRTEPDALSSATCYWRIVEITESLGLLEEGREMRHCVRSYQDKCLQGTTSIWSLRLSLSDNPHPRRLLTVEVNNQRRAIVQVRGKCNQTVSAMRGNHRMRLACDVLKQWACERHLGIACAL